MPLDVERHPVRHRRREACHVDGLLERARHEPVEQVEVIGARGAGVQGGQRGRHVARRLAGLRADDGQCVGVLLLRHERAGAAVPVGELDQPELLAGVDLEVLPHLAEMRGRDRHRREQLDVDVGLPGGVLGVVRRGRGSRAARPAVRGRAASATRRCRRRPRRCSPARGRRGAAGPRRAAPDTRRPAAGGRPSSAGRAAGRCNPPPGPRGARAPAARARRRSRRARRAARAPAGARPGAARRGRPRGAAGRRSASRRPTARRAAPARPRGC